MVAALLAHDNSKIEPPENPMSADRVRWEHIQRIYELCEPQCLGNRAPAQHAPPHAAADLGETRAALDQVTSP